MDWAVRIFARSRFLPTALALGSALILSACGSSGDDSGGTEPPPEPTVIPEPTSVPSNVPPPEPTPEPNPDPTPPGLRLSQVVSGLTRPLYVVSPPEDARLFVLEQTGAILVVVDGALLAEPFLDLSSLVSCCGERGLLGLAFAPDYADSGRFIVNYTDSEGSTVVAEYAVSTGDPNVADPTEVRRFLTIEQPFGNHNGGMVEFGPDGFLYVGMGDGGAAGDPIEAGQDPQSKLGAMLRLDIDRHPEPPEGNLPGADPDVWAIGLRNPWRFSFDRATGDLYIADVGQNAFEEVHVSPAGQGSGNYGWDIMEGFACFEPRQNCDQTGLFLPAVAYGRDEGISITGGYVYRGAAIPDLAGWYLYADFGSNRVWALQWSPDAVVDTEITDDIDPDRILRGVSSFGQDAAGELYVVSYQDGIVYRVDAD